LICERCDGTGFEIVIREERAYARPCNCRLKSSGHDDDLSVACRIPPRYAHCNLGTFEPGNPSLRSALERAMNFCEGYPYTGPDEGLGLIFTGGPGVGKTHLAVSVLRELVTEKEARGQYWDFNELIREIRNSYNPDVRMTELQVLQPVIDTDVLLLDDLGAWKITDWMHDTLFFVLNSRYMNNRVTLITTNYSNAKPKEALLDDSLKRQEYLVERIGYRLRSRLMEMCVVVQMDADDRREQQQSGKRVAVLGRRATLGDEPPTRRGRGSSRG
jgi:DNA replication protein DnaC